MYLFVFVLVLLEKDNFINTYMDFLYTFNFIQGRIGVSICMLMYSSMYDLLPCGSSIVKWVHVELLFNIM